MRTYEMTLSAGVESRFIGGKFFQLMDSAAALDIVFYGPGGQPLARSENVLAGLVYRGKFNAVGITSSTGQDIQVGISDNDGEYNRLSGSVTATVELGDTLANGTGTANNPAAEIVPANASTKALHIINLGANNVVLGASGVTAANGATVLAPNEEIIIVQGAKAAWYGYCAAGANGIAFTRIT